MLRGCVPENNYLHRNASTEINQQDKCDSYQEEGKIFAVSITVARFSCAILVL